MDKFCRFSHPIPGNAKKCDEGHQVVSVLQCEIAGCNFGSKSISIRHQSIAETLLVGHTKKVHGDEGFYGVDPPSNAEAVVAEVIEDILNGAVDISQKKSEHDTFDYTLARFSSDKKQAEIESVNCPVCQNLFKYEIILKHHMRMFHEIPMKDEVKTPCPHCLQVFWSDEPKAFRLHKEKNHSLKNKTFPVIQGKSCPLCYKLFHSKTNVRRHILTEHENTLRIKCSECDRTFASKTALNFHIDTHSPNKEFVCKNCEVTFSSLLSYRSHQKQHNEPKKEKCPECEQVLVGKSSLSRHLKEIHFLSKLDTDKITDPVYGFICDQCDSKYKRKDHLKMHIESQHGDKKIISCDICGKESINKQNLMRHVKYKHSN